MSEFMRLLEDKERRVLRAVALVCALVLLGLLPLSVGLGRSHARLEKGLESTRKSSQKAEETSSAKKNEFLLWSEARLDIEGLRRKTFYREEEGIPALRLDIQSLFRSVGRSVPAMQFEYREQTKDETRKVTASFPFAGSYSDLKRLLAEFEAFPRFLFVERIAFLDIDPATGFLQLKISLAAYYAI